ncbi:MAG: class I SAM-dependent methyltransferase [Solirubrobacteraceae bacterium]
MEEAEEPWRWEANQARLQRVRQYVSSGTLLDVGCSTGLFLNVASRYFDAAGVEPDPPTSEAARACGLNVQTGTLADVRPPAEGFDAITMFHVIEHLRSPSEAIRQARALLRPGGVLVIETPTIDTLWFRVTRHRWRQLIPDHYFFFDRATLGRLLVASGLEPLEYEKVGRRISLRFAIDRARRAGLPGARQAASLVRRLGLENATFHLRPGDIMSMTATAREAPGSSELGPPAVAKLKM